MNVARTERPSGDAAPSAWRIHQVLTIAQATLESLCNDHGIVLETEAELRAALAQEGASVDGLLAAICSAALDAKADVEAANSRIDALCARRDRAAKREGKLRETLLEAMRSIGLRTFSCTEASVTVSPGKPKVIITDADALPDSLVKIETVRTPDRVAILKALLGEHEDFEFAEVVSGATLSNAAPYLSMRVK